MSAGQQEEAFGSTTPLPKLSDLRQQNRSDHSISSRTASLEAALRETLTLKEKLEDEAVEEAPQQTLMSLLSTRSAISTLSSFAEHHQAAAGSNAMFREIGTGSIGKGFEQPGSVWASRLPLLDRTGKLGNNYVLHLSFQSSFDKLGHLSEQVEIPRAAWFTDEASDFGQSTSIFSPTNQRNPGNIERFSA